MQGFSFLRVASTSQSCSCSYTSSCKCASPTDRAMCRRVQSTYLCFQSCSIKPIRQCIGPFAPVLAGSCMHVNSCKMVNACRFGGMVRRSGLPSCIRPRTSRERPDQDGENRCPCRSIKCMTCASTVTKSLYSLDPSQPCQPQWRQCCLAFGPRPPIPISCKQQSLTPNRAEEPLTPK